MHWKLGPFDLDEQDSERDRDDDDGAWDEPEARPNVLENLTNAHDDARCMDWAGRYRRPRR